MAELVAVEIRDKGCPTFESIVAPVLPALAGCAWAFEGSTPFTALGPADAPFPEDEELVGLFHPAIPHSDRPAWEIGWLRPGARAGDQQVACVLEVERRERRISALGERRDALIHRHRRPG